MSILDCYIGKRKAYTVFYKYNSLNRNTNKIKQSYNIKQLLSLRLSV